MRTGILVFSAGVTRKNFSDFDSLYIGEHK